MRSLGLIWTFLRVNALNELQYRANLVVQVFQSGISLFTGLAVIGLVFGHTDNLNGWTQAELYCVMGIHIAMGGLIGTIIQPNMVRLMEEIRDGKLDFALTKPADAQVLTSVREVQIWRAVDVVIGAIVVGFGLSGLDTPVTPAAALAFAVAVALGARDDLLLLADHHRRRLLGSAHGPARRAVRRRLSVGPLAGHHLPGLAAGVADLSRADRFRRDRAGRGTDLAADGRDAGHRCGLRAWSVPVHALVVALWVAALLGGIGLTICTQL